MGFRPPSRRYRLPPCLLHIGVSFTTDGSRVLRRSFCYTSGSSLSLQDLATPHTDKRHQLPRPGQRLLHFPAAQHGPQFFHNTRPDFLPLKPYQAEEADNATTIETASLSLYRSRYLPDEDYPLPVLPSANSHPSLTPLISALETSDAEKAWIEFSNLSSDWYDHIADDISFAVRERLWWAIASSVVADEPSPQLTRLQHLFDLFENPSFQSTIAPKSYKGVLLSLHKQRLLYLIVVHLEQTYRSYRPPVKKLAAVLPSNSLSDRLREGMTAVLASLEVSEELIDVTILPRLIFQFAIHGRTQSSLQVYKSQRALTAKVGGGFPRRLQGLNTRNVEALLNSLTLGQRLFPLLPLDQVGKEIALLAVEIISLAIDDGVAVGKLAMSSWMKHLPRSLLIGLLPQEVIDAANLVKQSWALVTNEGESISSDRNIPDLREDVKHSLCDAVAFRLALRGDTRIALALYHLDQTSGRVDAFIRSAVIRGLETNIRRLIESSDADTQEQAMLLGDAALDTLLETYFGSATILPRRKDGQRDAAFAIDALQLLISTHMRSSLSQGFDQETWVRRLRSFTSSLLAYDPTLESITVDSHAILIRLHVALNDALFTRDLWIKAARRGLNDSQSLNHELSTPLSPIARLKYAEFAWFLTQTLETRSEADLMFAVQIYLDWQAQHQSSASSHLDPRLGGLLVRRLAQSGMVPILKRIINDMKHRRMPVTSQLARIFVEAFRYPDAVSTEQNLEIVEELARLYKSHEETQTRQYQDARQYFLPLELFANVLMQATSQYMEDWNHHWYIRLLDLFAQFTQSLSKQLAYRNSQSLSTSYHGSRITEEAVRQAFNGAMRVRAEWPSLALYNASQEDELPCLLAGVSSFNHLNEDLVNETGPMGIALRTSPSTRGEARRGAILDLVRTLEGDLSIAGDSETWSLKVFAWLLPGDPVTLKDRLAEALKIYEASLEAEFDYHPEAVLKPWARLPAPAGRAQMQARRSEGDSLVVTAKFNGDEATSDSFSTAKRTSYVAPSNKAIMKRVRVRSRTTARLILTLARNGDFASAEWVYETAMRRSRQESRRNSEGSNVTSQHSPASAPHPPSVNRTRFPSTYLDQSSSFPSLATHSLRYARVGALILQGRDDESLPLWHRLWKERRHFLTAGWENQRSPPSFSRLRVDVRQGDDEGDQQQTKRHKVWSSIKELLSAK